MLSKSQCIYDPSRPANALLLCFNYDLSMHAIFILNYFRLFQQMIRIVHKIHPRIGAFSFCLASDFVALRLRELPVVARLLVAPDLAGQLRLRRGPRVRARARLGVADEAANLAIELPA